MLHPYLSLTISGHSSLYLTLQLTNVRTVCAVVINNTYSYVSFLCQKPMEISKLATGRIMDRLKIVARRDLYYPSTLPNPHLA